MTTTSRSRMTVWSAALALLCAALVVTASSCGGGAKAPQSASMPDGPAPAAAPGRHEMIPDGRLEERKDEIRALLGEIGRLRQKAGLEGAEPSSDVIAAGAGVSMSEIERVCPETSRPDTQRCQDVCKLGDSICDNAERICRISEELVGDEWAQGKCSSAKASCKEAKQSCCGCQ